MLNHEDISLIKGLFHTEMPVLLAPLVKEVMIMRQDIAQLKIDVAILKQDVAVLKIEMKQVKQDIRVMKKEIKLMKTDIRKLNKNLDITIRFFDDQDHRLDVRLSRVERTIFPSEY